jgi:NADPH:quinone reductase-like Zn-dependent oxidoreductase
MRAVTVNDYGETPVLTELPVSEPAAGQVLIELANGL